LSVPERPRVAIYFQMFSPYIVARLNAAAERMNLIAIEGSRRSTHYAWEPREGEDRFVRTTLFRDAAVEDLPAGTIAQAVRAALDAADPDVVVANGWSRVEALTMLDWARRHGRRAIVMSESTRIDAPRTLLREAPKRMIVRQFDAALVGGTPQRDYIEELGMPAARVFTGYDVVDNDFWEAEAARVRADAGRFRHGLGLPEQYFLASSRFLEKKNLARLIEAFARYRDAAADTAWKLVLVGDGTLRPALEQQVAALELHDTVQFAGFRQVEELPAFYALAGGFVHVSTVEQWGLVVNEAMASGLPVIVSRNCGCAADLVWPDNGWSIDPLDVPDIARALAALADPACDRPAMGAASLRHVAAFHPSAFGNGLQSAVALALARPAQRLSWRAALLIRALAARGGKTGG
jgi:glycosyltransferase involved in cell wall biosynthesis